jgi:hypothetical protein
MMPWEKIRPTRGKPGRTTFAVHRSGKHAWMHVPGNARPAGMRVDVFADGGRLAWAFREHGEFKVNLVGATARVFIPSAFAACIPPGTTEVSVTTEDGMLVLDLAQFTAAAAE